MDQHALVCAAIGINQRDEGWQCEPRGDGDRDVAIRCPYKTSGDERSGDKRSGDERSGDERSGIINVRQ